MRECEFDSGSMAGNFAVCDQPATHVITLDGKPHGGQAYCHEHANRARWRSWDYMPRSDYDRRTGVQPLHVAQQGGHR